MCASLFGHFTGGRRKYGSVRYSSRNHIACYAMPLGVIHKNNPRIGCVVMYITNGLHKTPSQLTHLHSVTGVRAISGFIFRNGNSPCHFQYSHNRLIFALVTSY